MHQNLIGLGLKQEGMRLRSLTLAEQQLEVQVPRAFILVCKWSPVPPACLSAGPSAPARCCWSGGWTGCETSSSAWPGGRRHCSRSLPASLLPNPTQPDWRYKNGTKSVRGKKTIGGAETQRRLCRCVLQLPPANVRRRCGSELSAAAPSRTNVRDYWNRNCWVCNNETELLLPIVRWRKRKRSAASQQNRFTKCSQYSSH